MQTINEKIKYLLGIARGRNDHEVIRRNAAFITERLGQIPEEELDRAFWLACDAGDFEGAFLTLKTHSFLEKAEEGV